MKALFKDSYESLIGNCDEFLYLGGNEKEGHKYVSELLEKRHWIPIPTDRQKGVAAAIR